MRDIQGAQPHILRNTGFRAEDRAAVSLVDVIASISSLLAAIFIYEQ